MVTPDEVVAAIWDYAAGPECDGVYFSAHSDQWWLVTAHCNHGKYSGTSSGPMDISTAFAKVLVKFTAAHATIALAASPQTASEDPQ